MEVTLDIVDKSLLNRMQTAFPLERRPFAVLGKDMGLSADDVISRVSRMKKEGMIRGIGGIFEASRLGYRSTLAAMRFSPDRLDEAARIIGGHPGVSHNYARNHHYNLWFTLTLPGDRSLDGEIAALAVETGAESFMNLPAIRVFKIKVYFDMGGDGESSSGTRAEGGRKAPHGDGKALSGMDIGVVKELQADLPLEDMPFDGMAERLGLAPDAFLEQARELQGRGIMRRYSVSLRHRKAGFTANGMGCWIVPEHEIADVGGRMASNKAVSHCYQRPVNPDWPYSLFTMIHGHSEADCRAVAGQLSADTGIKDYIMLFSSKEYKKERVHYFGD